MQTPPTELFTGVKATSNGDGQNNNVNVTVNVLPPKPSSETFLECLLGPVEKTIFSYEAVRLTSHGLLAVSYPSAYVGGFLAGTAKAWWDGWLQPATSGGKGKAMEFKWPDKSFAETLNGYSLVGRMTYTAGAAVGCLFVADLPLYQWQSTSGKIQGIDAGHLASSYSGYADGRDLSNWTFSVIDRIKKVLTPSSQPLKSQELPS